MGVVAEIIAEEFSRTLPPPEAQEPCPRCEGRGYHIGTLGKPAITCSLCVGSGRAPAASGAELSGPTDSSVEAEGETVPSQGREEENGSRSRRQRTSSETARRGTEGERERAAGLPDLRTRTDGEQGSDSLHRDGLGVPLLQDGELDQSGVAAPPPPERDLEAVAQRCLEFLQTLGCPVPEHDDDRTLCDICELRVDLLAALRKASGAK